ncbi:MAG: serine hydrolase [Syntrophaceae bacterium]|nr:serine hydrolase [Syntrophaceae bacterium]
MAGRYSKILLIVFLCIGFLSFSFNEGFSKSSKKSSHHRKYSTSKSVKRKRPLVLHSSAVYVKDQTTGKSLIQKKGNVVVPIASITKLMTAMVVLDADLDLDETITIEEEDIAVRRGSYSRLVVGTDLTREEVLLLALMSSDNRCARALGRTYPGGFRECVRAMNVKARSLGLSSTRFQDTTGLSGGNLSSAKDLAKLVDAAYQYDLIRDFTTRKSATIFAGWHILKFRNTNKLVRNSDWDIGLSKTGFTGEAGKCLVMQANVAERSLLIILLHARNSRARINDANRIKSWLESRSASEQT